MLWIHWLALVYILVYTTFQTINPAAYSQCFKFVPSMSDVKSQRQLKNRLHDIGTSYNELMFMTLQCYFLNSNQVERAVRTTE